MFRVQQSLIKKFLFAASFNLVVVPLALASSDLSIDNLSFYEFSDRDLFLDKSTIKQEFQTSLGVDKQVRSSIELEVNDNVPTYRPTLSSSLNTFDSQKANNGFKIKNLKTSWQGDAGTLTVGSDWANFQNFLSEKEPTFFDDTRVIENQIKWLSPNGFSVSLEGDAVNSLLGFSPNAYTDNKTTDAYTNLILSWQSDDNGLPSKYRVSLQGKKFNIDGAEQSLKLQDDQVHWAVNMKGGRQIGDLFAALSVTYGRGIDSYVLQRSGDNLLVTPNSKSTSFSAPLDISPSLYYQLTDTSNIYVVLSRYTAEKDSPLGVDTLDTIHMSYNWNPWPSTKLGVEFIGSNAAGSTNRKIDNQIKFGAKTDF